MSERPPRPSIEITPYDESSWQVDIDAQTGLDVSVKVGETEDGRAYVAADPDSDSELEDQSDTSDGESPYALWWEASG